VVEREGEVRQLAALADESHGFVAWKWRGLRSRKEMGEVKRRGKARDEREACIYGVAVEDGRVRVECGGVTGR
jgi:hypothetical protein